MCPMCKRPNAGNKLGRLGQLIHYRCRDCGMQYFRQARAPNRSPSEEAEMKTVFLVRDQQERLRYSWRTRKITGYWVVAWRITDEAGVDLIQPWFNYRRQAREFAEKQGWQVAKEAPK